MIPPLMEMLEIVTKEFGFAVMGSDTPLLLGKLRPEVWYNVETGQVMDLQQQAMVISSVSNEEEYRRQHNFLSSTVGTKLPTDSHRYYYRITTD